MKEQELRFEELQTVVGGLRARFAGGKEVLDGGTRNARRFQVTDVQEIDRPGGGGLTPGGKSR